MICVNYPCDRCIHKREKIDGWKCACDAFPGGIPLEYVFDIDVTKLPECNNGIGYKPREDSE